MVKAHPDKYIEQPEKIGFQKAEISPQQPEPLNFSGYRECAHVETIVLLSREKVDGHIGITFDVEKLGQIPHTPLPESDTPPVKVVRKTYGRATYPEIKAYVLEKYGYKIPSLYIAQVKEKLGIKEQKNYYQPWSEKSRPAPTCPKEKEDALIEAFRHFGMID